MPEEQNFQHFLRRVRAGDAEAAEELVRLYEPAIRRVVRIRLVDPRLRRVFDSMDICQSVLASFFTRAALGQYQLDTPEQLLKLLAAMARHKVADQAAREQADRRDNRRLATNGPPVEAFPAAASDPGQGLAAREILDEVRRRLSAEERQLLELRSQGQDWATIAAAQGGSAEALRKRLSRAIDRVMQQMNL
jgi:RNA polymerase sigma-70 factor (ECF subfamily)